MHSFFCETRTKKNNVSAMCMKSEDKQKASQISCLKYEIQTKSLDDLISQIKYYLFLNKKVRGHWSYV